MADWLGGVAVGHWFQADGEPFEVIAIDIKNETILVQQFDGTLDDYDFEAWMDLGAKPAAAPEDWSGALDLEAEDYGVDNDSMAMERWDDPLDYLDAHHI